MKKIIEVKDIVKKYGDKVVLDNVSFDVYENEHVALIGSNGSGKSTLVEIILQTTLKNSGIINYNFEQTELYKVFGIQFQEANYPKGLKVKDIIKFFANIYDVNDKNYLSKLKNDFNLNEIENVKIGGLSGGQLQRLNIMLALIHKPKFLILDEITNGLDIKARHEIKAYIKKFILENNLTLLIISHNVDEIKTLANRVLFLDQGKIKHDNKIEKLNDKYGSLENYVETIFGGYHD